VFVRIVFWYVGLRASKPKLGRQDDVGRLPSFSKDVKLVSVVMFYNRSMVSCHSVVLTCGWAPS
jgi:hypothetical protein